LKGLKRSGRMTSVDSMTEWIACLNVNFPYAYDAFAVEIAEALGEVR
jgi:hypothetical protein